MFCSCSSAVVRCIDLTVRSSDGRSKRRPYGKKQLHSRPDLHRGDSEVDVRVTCVTSCLELGKILRDTVEKFQFWILFSA